MKSCDEKDPNTPHHSNHFLTGVFLKAGTGERLIATVSVQAEEKTMGEMEILLNPEGHGGREADSTVLRMLPSSMGCHLPACSAPVTNRLLEAERERLG